MEFCDECGAMMKTQGEKWVCSNGHEKLRDTTKEAGMVSTASQEEGGVVDTSDVDATEIGPTTTIRCRNPDCDSDTARYEMKQIRSADESETRFFTCVECGHKWREDDH